MISPQGSQASFILALPIEARASSIAPSRQGRPPARIAASRREISVGPRSRRLRHLLCCIPSCAPPPLGSSGFAPRAAGPSLVTVRHTKGSATAPCPSWRLTSRLLRGSHTTVRKGGDATKPQRTCSRCLHSLLTITSSDVGRAACLRFFR
ncbi:hypothetical protein BV20DRAFT_8854 [Pilatotrama ljubarskyi]|nr:hypothetical protein BV20DRAFT_8854 [Pilatotrama ljubarskyi]